MNKKRIILFITLLFGTFLSSSAQVSKFKAAYLYNICRFVEWPPDHKNGDFVIGVVNSTSVRKELMKISSRKKILGRKVKVVNLSKSDIPKCHVLYVGSGSSKYISMILKNTKKKGVLVVSDKKGMLKKGAAINFFLVSNKLKFEVKKVNVTKQSLKISPAIFKLATRVI